MSRGAAAAPGMVVSGHGAASGRGSTRYPAGTLDAQFPLFADLGLDLGDMFRGTINVDTAPRIFIPGDADHTFAEVAWSDDVPPEDFSFHRCTIHVDDEAHAGWVYRPHPETKVEHPQVPTVVECLAPHIPAIAVGVRVVVRMADGRGWFA